MRGKLKQIENDKIKVDSIGRLKEGDFISFRLHSNIGEELYKDGKKIKIKKIDKLQLFLEESMDINLDDYHKIEWCLKKMIFLHKIFLTNIKIQVQMVPRVVLKLRNIVFRIVNFVLICAYFC